MSCHSTFGMILLIFQNQTIRSKSKWNSSSDNITTDIKQAILRTAGPVATPKSVKAAKRSLNYHMTTEQFLKAAKELEKGSFGRLISLPNTRGGKPCNVFLKNPPGQVQQILEANKELCTPSVYCARYKKGTSKRIGFPLRAKLVAMKLVSQDHFL